VDASVWILDLAIPAIPAMAAIPAIPAIALTADLRRARPFLVRRVRDPGVVRSPAAALASRASPVTGRYPEQPLRCGIVTVNPGAAGPAGVGEKERCGTPGT
jgi:hypothetical protein